MSAWATLLGLLLLGLVPPCASGIEVGGATIQEPPSVAVEGNQEPPPPPGQTKISFKPPQLDEEEQESMVIPPVYRCDACRAVAFQVQRGFVAAEVKKQGHTNKRLREMELLEATEHLCNKDTRCA